MQVLSLGQEDPLEEGMDTHCNILAWRIPWTGAWRATVYGITKSCTRLIIHGGFPGGSAVKNLQH